MAFWKDSLTVGQNEINVTWGDEPADYMREAIYNLTETAPRTTVQEVIDSFHRAYQGEESDQGIDQITYRALRNIRDAFLDTEAPLTRENLTYGVRFATFNNDLDTRLIDVD